MTINRTQAAAHLRAQFDVLASEIGQTSNDDSATGFGPDIDAALRRLGTAQADLAAATVTDANAVAFLALCEYFALRRISRKLASYTEWRAGDVVGKENQVFEQVKAMMAEAAEQCAGLGYPMDGTPAWGVSSFTLDFIEPGVIE